MRTGRSHRADAITNSPFVRALIRPVSSVIPAAPTPQSPPRSQHLIPTQPVPVLQPEADTKKRKRELEDEGEEEQDALEVVVSYSEDNLPPELNKCESYSSIAHCYAS
jgi:trimethylguanosine synthase